MKVETHDLNGIHPNHQPLILAMVVLDGVKYMAMQTRTHEIMPGTWGNPLVARIPMDWTMGRLLSSGCGVCEPIWSIVANGYGDGCEIVIDQDVVGRVVKAIEDEGK